MHCRSTPLARRTRPLIRREEPDKEALPTWSPMGPYFTPASRGRIQKEKKIVLLFSSRQSLLTPEASPLLFGQPVAIPGTYFRCTGKGSKGHANKVSQLWSLPILRSITFLAHKKTFGARLQLHLSCAHPRAYPRVL